MSSSILLKNATILVPSGNGDDTVAPLKGYSLLIEDNKIAQISADIVPPSAQTEVLDCTGKIVAPGFIDTHHHVWQTQLKGRHADQTLVEYMPCGNMQASNYAPEDVFWGTLSGCLEALDAGTTTLVDHAHMNASPTHSLNGVEGTISSGIRSIFCYSPTMKVTSWKPEMVLAGDMLDEWVLKQLEDLAAAVPLGDGRVQLGLGFDGLFLPKDLVVPLYDRARKAGVKVITSHYVPGYFAGGSLVDVLDNYGLLGPDILLSHATNISSAEIEKLVNAKAWITCAAELEHQMGHGYPVCFDDGCAKISSLGIDCHSNNSGDMVHQMRLALQSERARRNEKVYAQGNLSRSLDLSVQDAFRLGTIQGARAIRMEDQLGSIEVGKLADLVIFDARSPGMICAAEQDPVAAIILHSSIRDIDTVIVNGLIRKRNRNLVPIDINPHLPGVNIPKQKVDWAQVAQELLSSRERIEDAIKQSGADDLDHQLTSTLPIFYESAAKFV
ncbi:Metallo-dependent hydrolase [Penicillium sp. IBT 16267x]|nr:Metallo-dependent hydrolase [Penicillium sp. IBT 16267x]